MSKTQAHYKHRVETASQKVVLHKVQFSLHQNPGVRGMTQSGGIELRNIIFECSKSVFCHKLHLLTDREKIKTKQRTNLISCLKILHH
jgi:hypothetical protein